MVRKREPLLGERINPKGVRFSDRSTLAEATGFVLVRSAAPATADIFTS